MKYIVLVTIFATSLLAQDKGLWQGYDGEWDHVSRQLLALAEATPQEKFLWRPAAGVRSTSEVYMHIALSNFMLLGATGVKIPDDAKRPDLERKPLRNRMLFPGSNDLLRQLKRTARILHLRNSRSE